ncbi:MAG: transposase [Anaerolineales bacterium]
MRPFHSFRRVHLIWDGGPSHTSAATTSFLRSRYGSWLRVLSTPAHSSWLNQAEILLKSFEVRYLQRGNWKSRQHLIDHLYDSTPQYNRLWARRDLHNWAEKKSSRLC